MSDILANNEMEEDMTNKFLCVLYFKDRNDNMVRRNGMVPRAIWDIMGYHAFHENVIPQIIDTLKANNINRGYIEPYNENLRLTEIGRRYGSEICHRMVGVT